MANRLERYAELVRRWASRLDLVAPGDLDRFEARHIADCLRLAPLFDDLPDGPCADLGSGAGLPGIPLAIARPERTWRLIEPRHRRAAFLEEVVRELGLTCEVVVATGEQATRDPRLAGAHAAVTVRALTAPEQSLAAALPLVAPGGAGVVFVGAGAPVPRESVEWAPGIAIIRTNQESSGI